MRARPVIGPNAVAARADHSADEAHRQALLQGGTHGTSEICRNAASQTFVAKLAPALAPCRRWRVCSSDYRTGDDSAVEPNTCHSGCVGLESHRAIQQADG